jgi:hypothetical protein
MLSFPTSRPVLHAKARSCLTRHLADVHWVTPPCAPKSVPACWVSTQALDQQQALSHLLAGLLPV